MNKKSNRSLKLGFVVTAGLLIFITAIYLLGQNKGWFTSVITIRSEFRDVQGLVQGNKVQFAGINVGNVEDVKIVSDSTVEVSMSIDKDVQKYIKKDSKVQIETEGVMGNKIVTILPGNPHTDMIEDQEVLANSNKLNIDDVLKETMAIIKDSRHISDNIRNVTNKINKGDGDLGRMVNDSSITESFEIASMKMMKLASNLEGITKKINEGENDIANLINDDKITTSLEKILQSLDSTSKQSEIISGELAKTVKEIRTGNGIMNLLIYDSIIASRIDTTVYDVRKGVESIDDAAEAVENSWLLNLFSTSTLRL